MSSAYDHDGVLTEASRQILQRRDWPERQEMVLGPLLSGAQGRQDRAAAQRSLQPGLHAPVPALRHFAGTRVAGGDEHRGLGMMSAEQAVRGGAAPADADADAAGLV
jgi:hypothetical protein